MIQTNAGHNRHVGINHIYRVETTAQPHFKHDRIQPLALEQPERGQGAEFKIGQGDIATGCINGSKGIADRLIIGLRTIDTERSL